LCPPCKHASSETHTRAYTRKQSSR
jgi:hypothetical protein